MTDTGPLVLLIEDEVSMRRFLRASLIGEGYRVVEAERGQLALDLAVSHNPDIVLLDLGLPDLDGIAVTERLRQWSSVPIIIISAREQELDKVRALDAGADDYVTKPFATGELLARMRVARRHAAGAGQSEARVTIAVGGLRVDLVARVVHVDGQEIHLTPHEYKLLVVLAKNAGKVVTHRQLLRDVWGPTHTSETHYLRVYMGQLRAKLEPSPARPRYLITEPGVGYRLRNDEPPPA